MTKIASMTGIARGTVIGKRDGVQPADEAEHVFKFEMCGDWFDMRDLRAVLDHGRAPAPIASNSYWLLLARGPAIFSCPSEPRTQGRWNCANNTKT
jgi:hypothetical protein